MIVQCQCFWFISNFSSYAYSKTQVWFYHLHPASRREEIMKKLHILLKTLGLGLAEWLKW
jgi:hypothetical protein